MIKKLITSLIIGVIVIVTVVIVSTQTLILDGIERKFSDFRFFIREPDPAAVANDVNPYVSDRVQLVGIDDRSLDELGKWPWYRTKGEC